MLLTQHFTDNSISVPSKCKSFTQLCYQCEHPKAVACGGIEQKRKGGGVVVPTSILCLRTCLSFPPWIGIIEAPLQLPISAKYSTNQQI